jgi:hypothetical protein
VGQGPGGRANRHQNAWWGHWGGLPGLGLQSRITTDSPARLTKDHRIALLTPGAGRAIFLGRIASGWRAAPPSQTYIGSALLHCTKAEAD